MEFGIGFVAGGVLAGFATAKSQAIKNTVHQWLAKSEFAVKSKMDAKAEALKKDL